jgi:hypothetical protein
MKKQKIIQKYIIFADSRLICGKDTKETERKNNQNSGILAKNVYGQNFKDPSTNMRITFSVTIVETGRRGQMNLPGKINKFGMEQVWKDQYRNLNKLPILSHYI